MAKNDFRIASSGGRNTLPTYRWQCGAGAAIPNAGEPLKHLLAGTKNVEPLYTGDSTVATDRPFVGVAADAGTNTSAVAGYVNVYMPFDGVIYEAKAQTAANVDTQSEIDALIGDAIVIDVTSSVFTFDEDAGHTTANLFLIVGGTPATSELHCVTRAAGTMLGSPQI